MRQGQLWALSGWPINTFLKTIESNCWLYNASIFTFQYLSSITQRIVSDLLSNTVLNFLFKILKPTTDWIFGDVACWLNNSVSFILNSIWQIARSLMTKLTGKKLILRFFTWTCSYQYSCWCLWRSIVIWLWSEEAAWPS